MIMAIEKKSLSNMSSGVRAAYQKARDVLNKNSLDYGIELLKTILEREPGFIEARQLLRDVERQKFEDMNPLEKLFGGMKANKFVLKGRVLVAKKPQEAMNCAEDALAAYFHSIAALNLLADAAKAAGAPFIAAEALEIIADFEPSNEANLKALSAIYESMGDGKNVLKICQKIADRHLGDLEAQAALRTAAALATMEQGRWGERNVSFQDKLKNQDKGADTEQGDRIIRAVDDVREMIAKYEKMIQEGETSVDIHRKLAELYLRDFRYEDAIREYEWIVKKMGTLDPSIDKAIERANVAIIERQIQTLKDNGASEEEIAAEQKKIYDYRLDRYEDRVKSYPNDLQLKYELAELYWEGGEIDKALEQFQLAQRNPQRRLNAIVYLGRCFAAKMQYDMAIEQFKKALSEMQVMDKDKMNALYHMGVTCESMGNMEEAMDCFKQIYSANVNYLDVGARMDAYYSKQHQQA